MRWALPAPPVVTGFYRMFFASVLVGAWLLLRGRGSRLLPWGRGSRLDPRSARLALYAGLCFGTDLALWNTSLVRTSVATATLLVNTTPLHVGLYAWLVLRQKPDTRFAGGASLALLGTALLLGRPGGGPDDAGGALLALTASLFYAGYLLSMSAARRGIDAVPALFLMSASAAGVLGLYGVLGGDAFRGFPPSSWAAMLGLALVSQTLGVMGVIWSLRYLPATLASVALLAQPVGAALLAWWLLGEEIAPIQALGGLAVLAGIFFASRRLRADPPPTPRSAGNGKATGPETAHSRSRDGR